MMMERDKIKRFALFTFIGSTAAPGILATLNLSISLALFSLVIASSVVLMTYFSVKEEWTEQGLYSYTKRLGVAPSRLFLITWLISYYLYVVYTVIYIPYFVLNLDGISPLVLSIFISISIFLLEVFTNPIYAFPVIYFAQIAFSLPLSLKTSIEHVSPTIPSLFINILSSSLLLVCITLSTFVRGDRSKDSSFILLAFLISSIILIYGTYLVAPPYVLLASVFGNYGLVLAELTAINNLVRPFISRKSLFLLNFAIIPLSLIGNINYSLFYKSLSIPSDVFLFFSLFIYAVSTLVILKGVKKIVSILSAFLFVFGEYYVITGTSGYLFYEAIASFISGIIISLVLFLAPPKRKIPG